MFTPDRMLMVDLDVAAGEQQLPQPESLDEMMNLTTHQGETD